MQRKITKKPSEIAVEKQRVKQKERINWQLG